MYIAVKKSELSAEGTKRDVENTPKFTRPDCILARSFSRCKLFMDSPGFKLNRNEQGQCDGPFFLRGPKIQDYELYYYTSFGYVEVHQREIGNIHEPKLT